MNAVERGRSRWTGLPGCAVGPSVAGHARIPVRLSLLVDADRVPVEAQLELETGERVTVSVVGLPPGEQMAAILKRLPTVREPSRWWG